MPRFTTLYSGSSGNAGVAEDNGRFLLIDMGGSCRATVTGLGRLGLDPRNLAGILVTHEHSDHIKGLKVFLGKYPVPLYSSAATLGALWHMEAVPECAEMVAVDDRVEDVDGFLVRGFATSHDAVGCCGFRVTTPSGGEMAIATDLGEVTASVFDALSEARLVALEANYDREQLRRGPYPAYLKRRIASTRGHLCNDESAYTVARLFMGDCEKVALCHLSKENNHPDLVRRTMEETLFQQGIQLTGGKEIQIQKRYEESPWMEF